MRTHPTACDKLNSVYALAALAAGVLAGAVTESCLVFLLATAGVLVAFACVGSIRPPSRHG